VNLPACCGNDLFSLCSLFFTFEIFKELAVNTNLFAAMKREMVAREKHTWPDAQRSVLQEQNSRRWQQG